MVAPPGPVRERQGIPESAVPGAEEERLSAEVRARVESGTYRVPLLPQVASQVMALVADPHVDAVKLSTLIHRDPALAGQVLRIANSPGYAPRMPIVSLQQAVARLGLNVISEIAFSASLQSGTFKVPGHEADLKALWRHALASGAWGKEVARLRRTNVESAFLCGLLHGVGKPALLQLGSDAAAALSLPLQSQWLPALFEAHQSRVGTRISEAWALPGAVAAAVAHHQHPSEAGKFQNEALLTRVASLVATWSTGAPGDAEAAAAAEELLRADPAFEQLNLYPEDVHSLVSKRDRVMAVVDALTV